MLGKDQQLQDKTRALLRDADETLLAVSHSTGITLSWLNKFNQGVIKNPGVVNIQTLYEYLTGEKLLRGR